MDIQITTQTAHEISCDALIISAACKNSEPGILLHKTATAVDVLLGGLIHQRNSAGEFKGKLGEILTIHTMGRLAVPRVIIVGLGDERKVDSRIMRRASAYGARHAQKTGAQQIALAIEVSHDRLDPALQVQAEVEGALQGIYTFRAYKRAQNGETAISHLKLLAEDSQKALFEQAARKAQILGEATNFARDLINEPPNVLTPSELAKRAQMMADRVGLACEIFDKPKITELGMGGLLGVAQGSAQTSHFVILRYQGNPSSKETMALVGKGITFDSGGISIKPATNMDEMKGDMGGAAAVLGAMQAIAQLKPQINITALVPTCENMPSATSYRPGDILRIMNGKTVEIVNTDAEGRLILADALSYAAREEFSPIIDLATLTGGIVVAIGEIMTGLFCNDETLSREIIVAGHLAGEKYWLMPSDDEYNEQIKSDVADVKQTGGKEASSVTAAKMLEHFIGNAKWAHLDIAGTSYLDSKKSYQEKGGTGSGVRTLAELALRLAQTIP